MNRKAVQPAPAKAIQARLARIFLASLGAAAAIALLGVPALSSSSISTAGAAILPLPSPTALPSVPVATPKLPLPSPSAPTSSPKLPLPSPSMPIPSPTPPITLPPSPSAPPIGGSASPSPAPVGGGSGVGRPGGSTGGGGPSGGQPAWGVSVPLTGIVLKSPFDVALAVSLAVLPLLLAVWALVFGRTWVEA